MYKTAPHSGAFLLRQPSQPPMSNSGYLLLMLWPVRRTTPLMACLGGKMEDNATLIAALLAAAASMWTALFVAVSKRQEDMRNAVRQAAATDVHEVGQLIHETIALSTLLSRYSSPETFKPKYSEAVAVAGKLKKKRLEVRYSLWGLDAGIRELTRLPSWLGHAKHDVAASTRILAAGKALGNSLDGAARQVYITGTLPGLFGRWNIERKRLALRKVYEEFSSSRPST